MDRLLRTTVKWLKVGFISMNIFYKRYYIEICNLRTPFLEHAPLQITENRNTNYSNRITQKKKLYNWEKNIQTCAKI